MKHYWQQSNLGLGLLLVGSWGLPATAMEMTPIVLAVDASEKPVVLSEFEEPEDLEGYSIPQPNPEQLSEISSLAVTAAPQRDAKPEWSSQALPLGLDAERLTASSKIIVAHDLSGQQPVKLDSIDHFEPEFAQAIPVSLPPAPRPQAGPSVDVNEAPPLQLPLEEGELLGQVEEDESEPEEAELIDSQAEEILDNSEAPAGDLLESIDGLEDRGIAGEGVGQDEPKAAVENSVEACLDQEAVEDCKPGTEASTTEQVDADKDEWSDTEAEALDNQAVDSEGFDSEEFEAEDVDFEEEEVEERKPSAAPSEASQDEAENEGDPDLGVLLLRPRPLAKKKPPAKKAPIFLMGNIGYIGNGNTLAGVDPVNDRLFRSGLSLISSPRISKRTALVASLQGNLYRYNELSRLNYNELRVQTSLRRVLTRRVYGDLGWTHRQLFLQDDGDRFLYEHAAFAILTRRDPITKKMGLNSFYNFRVSFADPETSSRVRNTLGVSLRHEVTPALQASLTGRTTLTNFSQQSRQDFYIQGLAQLSYKISKNFRLSSFVSLTRGNSSNRQVDFDNSTVGVSLSSSLKLF